MCEGLSGGIDHGLLPADLFAAVLHLEEFCPARVGDGNITIAESDVFIVVFADDELAVFFFTDGTWIDEEVAMVCVEPVRICPLSCIGSSLTRLTCPLPLAQC